MSPVSRPFKVLGIQQIAIGGLDKHKLQTLWIDMLGLELTGTYKVTVKMSTKTFAPWVWARSRLKWI